MEAGFGPRPVADPPCAAGGQCAFKNAQLQRREVTGAAVTMDSVRSSYLSPRPAWSLDWRLLWVVLFGGPGSLGFLNIALQLAELLGSSGRMDSPLASPRCVPGSPAREAACHPGPLPSHAKVEQDPRLFQGDRATLSGQMGQKDGVHHSGIKGRAKSPNSDQPL